MSKVIFLTFMLVSIFALSLNLSDAKSYADSEDQTSIGLLKNVLATLQRDAFLNQEDYQLKNGTVIKRYRLTRAHKRQLRDMLEQIDIMEEGLNDLKEMAQAGLRSGYYYD